MDKPITQVRLEINCNLLSRRGSLGRLHSIEVNVLWDGVGEGNGHGLTTLDQNVGAGGDPGVLEVSSTILGLVHVELVLTGDVLLDFPLSRFSIHI